MANPSRFEKLQITDNVQTTTATKVVFQETNGVLNTKNIDTSIIEDSNNPITSGAVYDAFALAANQLELKSENSASALSGFEITNNGNGTLNINGGFALLRDQNDPYAILQKYTIPSVTNLAMVDNANNFVLVDYNSGTPAIIVTQNPDTINGRTNSIIAGVSRVGTTLDYISLVGQGVDSWQKIRSRFLDTETVTRAKGLELGASGLAISCTPGIAYAGLNKLPVSLLNTHTQAHRTGSTWVRTTGLTNLNNTQYNNAGTLTTMTNGRFRVDYVYVLVDNPSKLYTIMGEVQYNTIADARLAAAPAVLPTELQFLGTRVGRLIVEKSATTVEVSSEFNTVYRAGSVQNHNDLALLNTGNYNHFRATTSADAGKVLSVNSQGVVDFATTPKAQFQSGELVDHLTIATAALEELFQLNSQPLVSNKHTFTLASGVVFPVTVHIETKAGSPSGYDGTAVIAASNNSFANGISPSFSNSYKVYMPNATTLVYEWVAGQEIYDGYWGDKLSLRVPENGVAKALTSKAYVDAGLASKFPTPTGLTTNYLPKWNGGSFVNSGVIETITGEVGIGITPSAKFEVLGNLRVNSLDDTTLKILYKIGVQRQWSTYIDGTTKNFVIRDETSNNDRFVITTNGNTLFNTTTDNGVDKVQVNGTITASPATASNQVVVKSQLDAVANNVVINYVPNSITPTVTNTTNEVQIYNVLIPPKTTSYNLVLENLIVTRPTLAGAFSVRVYCNTVPNLTGTPILLATNSNPANTVYSMPIKRTFRVIYNSGGIKVIRGLQGVSSADTDYSSRTVQDVSSNFDSSVNNYLIITYQGAATDSYVLESLLVKN